MAYAFGVRRVGLLIQGSTTLTIEMTCVSAQRLVAAKLALRNKPMIVNTLRQTATELMNGNGVGMLKTVKRYSNLGDWFAVSCEKKSAFAALHTPISSVQINTDAGRAKNWPVEHARRQT